MALNISSNSAKGRLVGLFLIGVITLVFAIERLTIMLTSRATLTPIKGTLENCYIYITTVSSKTKYNYEAISQKSELIFYLIEFKIKFALVENIGSDYRNKEYEDIQSKLKRADSVTVWIKKSELEYWEPKIFQIDADKETVLEFQNVRFKERTIVFFLLLFGIGCIIFPVYAFYPRLFKSK
jgi:hypothetical protein